MLPARSSLISEHSVASVITRLAILMACVLTTVQCSNEVVLDVETFRNMEVRPKQVLVKYRPPSAPEEVEKLKRLIKNATDDKVSIEQVAGLNALRVTSPDRDVATLVEAIDSKSPSDLIEKVEPNYVLRADALPDMWGLSNDGSPLKACGPDGAPSGGGKAGADIRAVEAWGQTAPKQVVVAVLDSGVKLNPEHPELKGVLWSAPNDFTVTVRKDTGFDTITCPKGSHGFNALVDPKSKSRCEPVDDNGHGTQVAGIVAAVGGNGVLATPRIQIMVIKVLDKEAKGDVSIVAEGIEFVTELKKQGLADVRVLNNSYGYTCKITGTAMCTNMCASALLAAAVRGTGEVGMLFVSSAGEPNNNNDCLAHFPSSFDSPNVVSNVISVAGFDHNNNLDYSQSNFGKTVPIAAPGVNICSTGAGSQFIYSHGTSLAAPFVSGAAALLLTKCDLSPPSLKRLLLSNADQLNFDSARPIGGGRLNAFRAITATACSP
jgi:subtilisin family serine protease